MNSAVIHPNNQTQYPCRPSKLFTAKRFVETKNLSQAEWLEVNARALAAVIVPQPVDSIPICRC
jgi:hypothetical protein